MYGRGSRRVSVIDVSTSPVVDRHRIHVSVCIVRVEKILACWRNRFTCVLVSLGRFTACSFSDAVTPSQLRRCFLFGQLFLKFVAFVVRQEDELDEMPSGAEEAGDTVEERERKDDEDTFLIAVAAGLMKDSVPTQQGI